MQNGTIHLLRLVSGLCLAILLSTLATPSRAACDPGPGTIAIERKAVADDNWRCLQSHPTLTELQGALSDAAHGAGALRVEIGPGDYAVGQTLELDDARFHGVAIEIDGAGAEHTILRGSVSVGSTAAAWTTPLDAALADRYLKANHGNGAPSTPHDLLFFDGDSRVVPGRWPAKGWGHIVEATRDGDLWRLRLADEANRPAQLRPGPLRLAGFPAIDWAYASAPALAISEDTVTVSAATLHYPALKAQRVTLEAAQGSNVESRISLDLAHHQLSGPPGTPLQWARTGTFLRITGMSQVTLRNATITGFSGDAITVAKSSDVVLKGLDFAEIGGRGVVITDGKRILVDHAHMRIMGEGGVDAGGGDRVTLEPSDITISNSTFERFSEIVMTYRPAVHVYGVGAKILDNRMHDAPHSAILFDGNDHLIRGNVIYDVVKETRDAGAILVARDWTTYGTHIEANVIAQVRGPGGLASNGLPPDTQAVRGIYLDDFTSGITIRENLFYEVDFGIFLNGGSDVHVVGNIFVRCNPPFAIYPWGLKYPRNLLNEHHRAVRILQDLRGKGSKLFALYPRLTSGLDSLVAPIGNEFVNNILIDGSSAIALRGTDGRMDLTNIGGKTLELPDLPNPSTMPDPIHSYLEAIEKQTDHHN